MQRNLLRSIRQQRYIGVAIIVLIALAGVILGITVHNRGNTNTLRRQVTTLQGQNAELRRENTALQKQVGKLTPLINSDIGETLKNRTFGSDSRRVICEVLASVDSNAWKNNTDCQTLKAATPAG